MDNRIDPERPRDAAAFDRADGYSGQDYTAAREAAEGRRTAPRPEPADPTRDLPADEGHAAHADARTGEVRGAGSGIGGGNPGEDFDTATPSGDSYPVTGGEGTDHMPGDLGPKGA